MSTVAIIPARGGSKRIPRKNVKSFGGMPMIAHSIRVAQETRLFDRIIVSTEDDEIMAIARHYGAEAPFRRPAVLADDLTGTDAVLQHALTWLAADGCAVEYFCCLYPTAPFVEARYLREGYDLLRQRNATTAVSVTTFPYPIFRAFQINDRGCLDMFWPENFAMRSQDLPEALHDAGQFYWADTARYWKERRLYSSDSVPVMIPRHLVQDIDTPEDWEAAEVMWQAMRLSDKTASEDRPMKAP